MRVINNSTLTMTNLDKNGSAETKVNTALTSKLLALIQSSGNGEVTLEAVLKNLQNNKGTLQIAGLGNLEVSTKENLSLTDQSRVNVKFYMQNNQLTATILPSEVEDLPALNSQNNSESVQLKQMGIPQNESNLKALKLLNEYHIEPSAERVKQLAEGSFLASKANQMALTSESDAVMLDKDSKIEWTKTLKSLVVDWLSQNTTEGKMIKENALNTELPDINTLGKTIQTTITEKKPYEQLTNAFDLEEMQVLREDAEQTQLTELKSLLQKVGPKQLLPLVISDKALNLENLLLSEHVFTGTNNIGHLKQLLTEKLTSLFNKIEPNATLTQEILMWVDEDPAALTFGKQLEQLEAIIIKNSPEAAAEMKESFEQINKSMNLVDQLQSQMFAVHIPIQVGEHDTQIELYMNKRKGRQSQDEFRMFLALNTHTMGQVQVLITDQKQMIDVQFRLENDELREVFENQRDELEKILKVQTEKQIHLKFLCHSKEPAVLEAFKLLKEDHAATIDMRI